MNIAYYLLKAVFCSAILFFYYHIALRNKVFHQWNRFYLLAAVAVSLLVPLCRFAILSSALQPPDSSIPILRVAESANDYLENVTVSNHHSLSVGQWAVSGYLTASIVLLISLIFSVRKIFSIVRSHSIKEMGDIKFINTNVRGTPFSFFRFIFWNNEISLESETGRQIFEHELVHVKEKHTLDKLFLQVVLIFFWCNPFFWLIRKELRLVHEFIADKKAVSEHGSAAFAAMVLQTVYPQKFNAIANQFFQTSIKRRLLMLKKINNPQLSYVSRILTLPVFIFIVLAFTAKTKTVSPAARLDKPTIVVIDAGHGIANGKKTGVSMDNVYEDDIVLALAKKIKEINADQNLQIILTRSGNDAVALHRRTDIAKENHADLFISLHINAISKEDDPKLYSAHSNKESGFEIYISSKNTSYQRESEVLGSVIQQELSGVYPTNPALLTRKTGIWVIDQNNCPAVLIECGFLTDNKDKEFITNGKNQDEVAKRIINAIERYASSDQKTGAR